MIKNIKEHFSHLGIKRFTAITVLILLATDIINSFYLRIYWVHKNISLSYVEQVAAAQGIDFNQIGKSGLMELKAVIDNGFFFFLLIIFVNNLFFYFFYLRKKIWARSYVVFYCMSNSILALLFTAEGQLLGASWFTYNILTIGVYFYLAMGNKILKLATNEATPADGRLGQ